VKQVQTLAEFWRDLGMREVHLRDSIAILELRGGTHLILLPEKDGNADSSAPMDLMVDDLAATHVQWSARGLRVSPIERGQIHDAFTIVDPEGHVVDGEQLPCGGKGLRIRRLAGNVRLREAGPERSTARREGATRRAASG
jgi:hypothetical protein